jgi:IclR family transcriptional regulator, acetate operon repressor
VTSPNGTQAVDRAAQLLLEVVRCPEPVSFTELTASTGLAKSTTSRLLMALERNGLIRRDRGGRFLPGEAFISYAWRGDAESDLVSVAQPILEELGAQTGETVNLGVARGIGMVVQIAQVDSRYLIGGTNWVGQSVPLHCAALGKVLLAYGAAELPDGRLERRTPRTVTSRAALAAELAAVRARGYAITDAELEPGLVAVAAPVRGDSSAVVAALSVSGPASRLTPERAGEVAAECVEQAGALSALLGHQPPARPEQARAAVRAGAVAVGAVRAGSEQAGALRAGPERVRPEKEGAA